MKKDPQHSRELTRLAKPFRLGAVAALAGVLAAGCETNKSEGPREAAEHSQAGQGGWTLLGPYRSETRCLAVDPGDPDTVFAAHAGFILRSSDGGQSWSVGREKVSPNHPYFRGLAVEPGDPPALYAGSNRGIFKSADGGESWSCVNEDFHVVADFFRAPVGAGEFYTCSGKEIYRSADGCLTWTKIAETPESATCLSPCAREPGLFFAGVHEQVGISRDGGRTWSCSRLGPPHPGLVRAVARNAEFPHVLYAGTELGGEAHGNLYRSPDLGRSWRKVDLLPEAEALRRRLQVLSIGTTGGNPSWVFAGTTAGLFIGREDGERLLFEPEARIPKRSVRDIAVAASAERVYAATDNGVYVSRDLGRTWSVSFSGFPVYGVKEIAVSPSDPSTVYAATGTLWRKRRGEPSWENVCRAHSFTIDPGPPEAIYARSSAEGELSRSMDGGDSWEVLGGIKGVSKLRHGRGRLCALRHGRRGATSSLFCSADGGRNWKYLNLLCLGRVEQFHVDPEDASRVYVGVRPPGFWNIVGPDRAVKGKALVPLKVCRTLDGGETWLDVPEAGELERLENLSSYATIIAGFSVPGKVLYAATFLGAPNAPASVLRSLDGGKTWEAFGDQSEMGAVTAIGVDPEDCRTAVAGCSGGEVYLTTDGGETWTRIRKPCYRGRARDIPVRPCGQNAVYVATGDGVYVKSFGARD